MTPLLRRRLRRRHPGLYRATVVDVTDPRAGNRLKVSVPSISGSAAAWAPVLRDLGPRPQVGDEVLVGFEAGLADQPVVVGVLATVPSAPVEIADDNGNSIRLTTAGIEVTTATKARLTASTVEISSSMVEVASGMSEFSGVVRTSTLIAESVVAASYSPGAGNIW